MNRRKLFNKERYGSEYGEGILTDANKLKLENALNFVLKNSTTKTDNALDIGCNPRMTKLISKKTSSRAIGINIIPDGMDPDGEWTICDIESGLPFVNNSFDLIFCGDVIEHTFDTDYFISEIYRILRSGGYLILTTPNLASLWNRIFLLLGYQPHTFGVSVKKSYGNPFLKWDRFCGHTKVFTYKSMKEFLKDNDFEILKISGEFIHNPYDNLFKKTLRNMISKIPSLSEEVVYICKKVVDRD